MQGRLAMERTVGRDTTMGGPDAADKQRLRRGTRGKMSWATVPHCRCRLVLMGAVASCLYVFLFVVISTRHLDTNFLNSDTAVVPANPRRRTMGTARTPLPTLERTPLVVPRHAPLMARLHASRRPKLSSRNLAKCSNMSYRNPPGPTGALASFPGSGNTWLRYLIQQTTGIFTGSIYQDKALMMHGFPAENVVNGSVLLVKTHEWGQRVRRSFNRAVLLVRDPYSAILAEFNRQAGGHIGHASLDKYVMKKGRFWREFVNGKTRTWLETNLDWLKFDGPIHIIQYENLTQNVEFELRKLLRFLDVQTTNKTMACVLLNKEGIYKRKKKDLNFDPYDRRMRAKIDKHKQLVQTAIRLHQDGLKPLLLNYINSVLETV